jgi:hypothetical protein
MKRILGILSIAGILSYSACKQAEPLNTSIGRPQVYQYSHAKLTAYAQGMPDFNTNKSQRFTISPATDTIIIGAEGTRLHIRPYCFRSLSESGLPEGEIQIELEEYYLKKDLVLSGATTISNNQLLVSDGSFYITMSDAYGALEIDCQDALQLELPFDPEANMQLFNGEVENSGTINWELSNQNTEQTDNDETLWAGEGNLEGDWSYQSTSRFFSVTKLGWINCDRFYDYTGERENLLVNTTGGEEKMVGQVFIVFDSLDAVLSSQYDGKTRSWGIQDLPKSEPKRVVALFQNPKDSLNCYVGFATADKPLINIKLDKIENTQLDAFLDKFIL